MKQFESTYGNIKGQGNELDVIDTVNKFGKAGWEPFSIDYTNRLIYFKREITEI